MECDLSTLLTIVCVLGIIFLLVKKNNENFENDDYEYLKQPDDKFQDNLDHPFGLKKNNRHHSF